MSASKLTLKEFEAEHARQVKRFARFWKKGARRPGEKRAFPLKATLSDWQYWFREYDATEHDLGVDGSDEGSA